MATNEVKIETEFRAMKFEYITRMLDSSSALFYDQLQEYGNDGWELKCSVGSNKYVFGRLVGYRAITTQTNDSSLDPNQVADLIAGRLKETKAKQTLEELQAQVESFVSTLGEIVKEMANDTQAARASENQTGSNDSNQSAPNSDQ